MLPPPSKILREKSAVRLRQSNAFQQVQKTADWVGALLKRRPEEVVLSWPEFEKEDLIRKAADKELQQSLDESHAAYEVMPGEVDKARYAADEYAALLNASWIKRLKSDIYVEESFQIMLDMIDYSQGINKN